MPDDKNSRFTKMTKQEIINAVASNKGGMFTVGLTRPAHVLKAFENVDLQVKSTMQLQKCDYSATAIVKNAIADGTRDKASLPNWIDPKSIEKVNGLSFAKHHNGTEYLRQPIFAGNRPTKVFYLDGKQVEFETIEFMLSSKDKATKATREELAEKGQVPYATIKLANIEKAN